MRGSLPGGLYQGRREHLRVGRHSRGFADPDARLRVKGPDPVEHLGALLGRGVAFALARDGVDEHGAPHLQGASERLLHKTHVMAVYRAQIREPELFEKHPRNEELFGGLLGTLAQTHQSVAHPSRTREACLQLVARLRIERAGAQRRKIGRQGPYGRGDRHLVVVQDHHKALELRLTYEVERLVRQPTRKGGVPDHRDDPFVAAEGITRSSNTGGGGQSVRGMARVVDVVAGLLPTREARNPALMAQPGEAVEAARHHLMGIRLVPHIKQKFVVGQVEHTVGGQNQLNRPKRRR